MKWVISTAIDSTKANSFLSRMHKYMGNPIINIEKERLYREGSSQEKEKCRYSRRYSQEKIQLFMKYLEHESSSFLE